MHPCWTESKNAFTCVQKDLVFRMFKYIFKVKYVRVYIRDLEFTTHVSYAPVMVGSRYFLPSDT